MAFAALVATHRTQSLAVARASAVRSFRADPQVRAALAHVTVTRIQVLPGDRRVDQVFAYDGARAVASADVSRGGTVSVQEDLADSPYAFGANTANDPLLLALLTAVFVLMTAVWPLRRLHNLDVAASAALLAVLLLFNDWLLADTVIVGYPLLCYLALRCAWVALRRDEPPRRNAPAGDSVPLFLVLTRGWEPLRRRRLLGLVAAAGAVMVAIVSYTSPNIIDVGYAVMEGATRITHGVLPYGHISDIVHGDTYPIGSYVLYVPFALITPVSSVFDNANLVLVVAIAATLLVAAALSQLARHPAAGSADGRAGAAGLDVADDTAGLRAAIAWMVFPTVLVTVSTGTSDPLFAALIVAAFALWRRPAAATGMLALAGWFKLAPFALVPVALARLRGPVLARSIALLAALSAAMLAIVIGLGGAHGLPAMLSAIGFQQTRVSPHALWSLIGSVPLQQLVQAATLALVAAATVLAWRGERLIRDPRRLAALFAAVLIGMQVSANYWSYLYLTWIVPFVVLSLLAPSAPAAIEVR